MRASKLTLYFYLPALCAGVTGCFPYHATTRMGVSGIILDTRTLAPVAGASISFNRCDTNAPSVVISQADGSFNLPKEKQWQIRFVAGDYLTDLLIGRTICIRHNDYETKEIPVQLEDEKERLRTKAKLGTILLKPLAKTH